VQSLLAAKKKPSPIESILHDALVKSADPSVLRQFTELDS